MKIQKILNNSVVISLDSSNKEIVVMGKGIAYGKRVGDKIDQQQVTKRFILANVNHSQNVINLLNNIPAEYVDIANSILTYTRERIGLELIESVYISLLDHIHSSVERYSKNIVLRNKLLWEIKNFYKLEFDVGLYALNEIYHTFNIKMDEDEAAFIALHIVSAEKCHDINQTYKETEFIHNITNIVKYYFSIEYDVNSLDYNRFITHLKFFSMRVFSHTSNIESLLDEEILDLLKNKYTEPYRCSLKIKEYINNKYGYILDNDEILYLTIHITKIIGKEL
ncbi:BglG family transcription antiterminator LicT [Lonepinella koalarum]|uniref:BglG family transcription antiterminator LicT n=1 Tax=Lonepinella koalarum TaxID=53417 RepID=UPI003F6DB221